MGRILQIIANKPYTGIHGEDRKIKEKVSKELFVLGYLKEMLYEIEITTREQLRAINQKIVINLGIIYI